VSISILKNATGNGDGPICNSSIQLDPTRRAPLTIYFSGVFASAAVTLYASPDGSVWLPIPNATYSAPGIANIDITAVAIKATVSGVTGTTNISAVAL
jgi:hypothetical protein